MTNLLRKETRGRAESEEQRIQDDDWDARRGRAGGNREPGGKTRRLKKTKSLRSPQNGSGEWGTGSHTWQGREHQKCAEAYLEKELVGRDGKQLRQDKESELERGKKKGRKKSLE